MNTVTIKCFACGSEHIISRNKVIKCDFYTCDTSPCLDALLDEIALKHKTHAIAILMKHKGPVKMDGNISGHNFFHYIDKKNIEYGIYGEQTIQEGNIYHLFTRTPTLSKRNDSEINRFINEYIVPYMLESAKNYGIPMDLALNAFYEESGFEDFERVEYMKKGYYDWLWEQEVVRNGYKPLFSV